MLAGHVTFRAPGNGGACSRGKSEAGGIEGRAPKGEPGEMVKWLLIGVDYYFLLRVEI